MNETPNSQISDIDQRELLNKVISNEIHWQDALNTITNLKKSWHTKEWKEKRKAKLGSQCEKCASTTPPLVLQHTWHPRGMAELFYELRKSHPQWIPWMQEHPILLDPTLIPPDADGCPKCGSTTIRYRKNAQTWICVCKTGGVTCGAIFTNPTRVVSHHTLRELTKGGRRKSQAAFDDEFGIGKKVVISAIEGHLRYISLKDTKTLCKKCAFVEDKTNMLLCAVCSQHYHSQKYDRCSTCAGVDTTASREIFESIKARKEWMKDAERFFETGDKRFSGQKSDESDG